MFLEIAYGPYRVLAVYFAGVVSGSLLTSIVDADIYLVGASAGGYAILLSRLPTIILNYERDCEAMRQTTDSIGNRLRGFEAHPIHCSVQWIIRY